MPRISIGLPVFNAINTIEKTVLSIKNQTFLDYEVIVFDNASTDGTLKVLSSYAQDDHRVKLNTRVNNCGTLKNFNDCFAASTGEFFCWWAADDWRSSDWLWACTRKLDEDRSAIAATTPYCFDHDMHDKSKWHLFEITGSNRLTLLAQNIYTSQSIFYSLIRRTAIESWYCTYSFKPINATDWAFIFYLSCMGNITRTQTGLQVGGSKGISSKGWLYTRNLLENLSPLAHALLEISNVMCNFSNISKPEQDCALAILLSQYGAPANALMHYSDLALYPVEGFGDIEKYSEAKLFFWCIVNTSNRCRNSTETGELRFTRRLLREDPVLINPGEQNMKVAITSQLSGMTIELECPPGHTIIPAIHMCSEKDWPSDDIWLIKSNANCLHFGEDSRDLYFAILQPASNELCDATQNLNNATKELNSIYSSRGWKLLQLLRSWRNRTKLLAQWP